MLRTNVFKLLLGKIILTSYFLNGSFFSFKLCLNSPLFLKLWRRFYLTCTPGITESLWLSTRDLCVSLLRTPSSWRIPISPKFSNSTRTCRFAVSPVLSSSTKSKRLIGSRSVNFLSKLSNFATTFFPCFPFFVMAFLSTSTTSSSPSSS